MKTTVTAYSTVFEVDYDASAGRPGTRWEPDKPAELIINSISIAGQNIDELLADFVTERIYQQLEEDLSDESRQNEEDAAEARNEYIKDMMRESK